MNQLRRCSTISIGCLLLVTVPAVPQILSPTTETHVATMTTGDSTITPGPEFLGSSGNLRAVIGTSASFDQAPELKQLLMGVPLDMPGIHALSLTAPDSEPLVAVSLEPIGAIQGSKLDGYRVGRWPTRGLAARDPRYAQPQGFIRVTRENESTPVSKRFQLNDFLTHDQKDVWPKVLVLRVSLLDKLELVGDALQRRGLPGELHVMSGFRTPQYNAQGVGKKGGRASGSRHMYGDAADVIVDGNRDGMMDDLNGDGKVTVRDARLLAAVVEGVEAEHPELVGGLSAYRGTSNHGPFVHVDARGVRARW